MFKKVIVALIVTATMGLQAHQIGFLKKGYKAAKSVVIKGKEKITRSDVSNRALQAVRYLVETIGIDVDSSIDHMHNTLLHRFVQRGDLSVVKYLVEKANVRVNATNARGETPLKHASCRGNLAIVKYLVEVGRAYVGLQDKFGWTPLHEALYYEHSDVAKYLINHVGTNVTVECTLGTPLHIASMRGDIVLVKLLLEKGTKVNAKNELGETPLHFACEMGRGEVVKYLVEHADADITIKDTCGRTPLHEAALGPDGAPDDYVVYNLPVVKYLVEKGSDIHAKDNEGHTALDLAKKYNDKDIDTVNYLLSLSIK